MGLFVYVGLPYLIARGQDALVEAVGEAAEDLTGKAQAITPVDTGTLQASIHVEGPSGGGNTVTAVVSTGGEADYAVFVHAGTSRMAGRPFLATALQENREAYLAHIAAAGRDAY